MSLYLDASVIVPAFIREDKSDAVERLFQFASEPMTLSNFASGELASAIARRTRMRLITAEQAQAVLNDFDQWTEGVMQKIQVDSIDIADATALVRRFELKLRLPDAIHLAACQRRRITLATLDDGLAHAARALGVAHICPA